MASKKTKKARKGGKGRTSQRGARGRSKAKKPSKSGARKKKSATTKKPTRKPAKKKPASKPARKAARKPAKKKQPARKPAKKKATKPSRTKAKSARKPKTAARSTSQSKLPVSSVTQGRVRLAAPGKTPKASLRRPEGAEELKAKIGALASATSQIRSLKRTLNRSFYDIGQILGEIESKRLYEVKGYGSFEAFVDREIDIGKHVSLKIVRIVQVFLREAALAAGLERLSAALDVLDGESNGSPGSTASGTRSPIPLHKQ